MEDARCCGTGTCIINADGECWCGQKWNGTEMSFPDSLIGKTTDDTAKTDGAALGKDHSSSST